MAHEESRKRVCVCCMHKIGRRDSRVIHLSEREDYLQKVVSMFPDYDVNNFWFSTVLCDLCATSVRKMPKDTPGKSFQERLQAGREYILAQKRRSRRENMKKEHVDCRLCAMVGETRENALRTFVEMDSKGSLPNKQPPHSKNPQGVVFVSHKDLKTIQLNNGLSQQQILGVLRDFRYATHGGLTTEPGFKEYLESENKHLEDLFQVLHVFFFC